MASVLLAIVAQRFDERRYFQSVDVVPAAFALRFEHIASSPVCIDGNVNGVFTLRCVIERVDGSESVTYSVDVCSR